MSCLNITPFRRDATAAAAACLIKNADGLIICAVADMSLNWNWQP